MRASIDHLIGVLDAKRPPAKIWQEPHDYDPSHYKRLCNLNGAAPDPGDLWDYAQDLNYAEKIQEDLFRYLLPICLNGWSAYLFPGGAKYGGFVEWFSLPLVRRSLLQECLTQNQYVAVLEFMRDAILDRMDSERGLKFTGMGASPYAWVQVLGSFAVVFPHLKDLWDIWWRMETNGHAICVLQYVSCLMYKDDSNPIFSPWTPLGGGGPPALWETDGHIYEHPWRVENVMFLQNTLSVEYVQQKLQIAHNRVQGRVDSDVPDKMLADFPSHMTILESRLAQLPGFLSVQDIHEWAD